MSFVDEARKLRRAVRIAVGAILALTFLVISSCVSYAPSPVDVVDNAAELSARSLQQEAVRELAAANGVDTDEWPPKVWTPRLLTLAALALNPELDVARADWNATRAAIRTAGEIPNPALVAGIEHKNGTTSLSPWVSSIVLGVPVEAPGKRSARLEQAQALEAAAAAEVDTTVWRVGSSVRKKLIDLQATQEASRLVSEELTSSRFVLDLVQKRVEAGEESRLELDRARAETKEIAVRAAELDTAQHVALAEAATAIGVPVSALAEVEIDLSELDTPASELPDNLTLRTLALTERSDVIASVARYAAAEASLRGEVRRQFPDLTIGPGFGWDQGTATWSIALEAELPIFNQHRGPIEQAVAARTAASARLLALQAAILGNLDRARAAAEGSRVQLEEANRAVKAEQSRLESARRQFDLGSIDRVALARRELGLQSSLADNARAIANLQRSLAELEDVLQRPLSEIRKEEE